MFKTLLLTVLAMVSTSHAAHDFFQQRLQEGLKLFPVSAVVEFEVVALKGDHAIGEDLCQVGEAAEFGRTIRKRNKHKIQISSRLVEVAKSNKRMYRCSHGTFERVLLATIVHELVHVRDNFERISLDPDFQRIVGMKRVTRSSRKELLNQNSEVSPDAYEFENLEEALAVNVEYLLLDEEFECRKPATANFLASRLGLSLSGTCKKSYQVVTQSAYLEDNYLHTSSIDPSRIYQIHYLFAGKGDALMSRWGHAMFRLVVCAPHRKVAGPECLRDVSHHLALSYRAHITDINISYRKGMFGSYPSQLFILRFHEVQQEYTKFELRDLYSIPLKLTNGQKLEFLDLTLERFWTYQGKYYFLDNNCGTETQKHLAFALSPEQSELLGSITPSKIYKDVIKHLTNVQVKELKREELITQGFLLPSLSQELHSTYSLLRSFGLFKEKKFKRFLKKTTALKRLEHYRAFFAGRKMSKSTLKKLTMRLVYLERFLMTRFFLELPKRAMLKMNKDPALKAQVQKMGESLQILGVQPWQVVDSSYGVPTLKEFEEQYSVFFEKRKNLMEVTLEEQMKNLQGLLGKDHFVKELTELESFNEIKKITNELLRESL